MDERTRLCEELLAIVARAVYSDGVVEETERELVKRVVRALEVDTARAKEILAAAKREAPFRSTAGPADAAAIWSEARHLLAALPSGSGRRMLAARVGWALDVAESEIAAVVQALAPGAPPPADYSTDGSGSNDPASMAAEALGLAARLEPEGAAVSDDDGLRLLELLNTGDLAVVAALAPAASRTGQIAALDPALTALVSAGNVDPATYQAALAGALAGVTREDPATGARMLEVVDLAERLAKIESSAERDPAARWVV